MGCGLFEVQLVSASASSGNTGFEIIGSPFVDGLLCCGDPLRTGLVGGACLIGGCACVGDGYRECGLFLLIESLEALTLLLPMNRFELLDTRSLDARSVDFIRTIL